MSSAGRFAALALIPALLTGCASDEVSAPRAPVDTLDAAFTRAGGPVDIEGTWNWSRVIQLTAPDWVAAGIFGIPPEGPVTHFRCEASGTLDIEQNDGAFSGTATRTIANCETKGGYDFLRGPTDLLITAGLIRGNSVEFTLIEDNGTLLCPYHGIVSEASNGTATALRGTGRCIIPGHPASPVPLDPPPAGTSKVLEWEIWR